MQLFHINPCLVNVKKLIRSLVAISAVIIALYGCALEEVIEEKQLSLTGAVWKFAYLSDREENIDYYPTNDYLLLFKEDSSYQVKLDINACFGDFSVAGGEIFFDDPVCTEFCCDTDFSSQLPSIINRVDSFRIEEDQLFLNAAQYSLVLDFNSFANDLGLDPSDTLEQCINNFAEDLVGKRWVPERISLGASDIITRSDSLSLYFFRDCSYLIEMQFNSCSGKFETPNENEITLESMGCTDACCENEFSDFFVSVIHEVDSIIFTCASKDCMLLVNEDVVIELTAYPEEEARF